MKRISALILAALCLVPCLAGCVREDVHIKINGDGGGEFSITVAVKKAYYDEIIELGENPFAGKESFEAEYEGEKYVAVTQTSDYSSYQEMQDAISELKYDTDLFDETDEETKTDNHIFKKVAILKDGSNYMFNAILNKVDTEVHGQKMSDAVRVTVSVEMPANISEYKGGRVDGNKVIYEITDLGEDVELYAVCRIASKVPVFIAIGLAAAAGIACIILKKRK